jgi:hypothetical protein
VRSQIRFVMHPDDEVALITELLRDPTILLVDGPRWKSVAPPTTRDISAVGHYCLIWSPDDLPELPAEFIPSCNDWYCRGEHATIQLLRSAVTGTMITDGRLAIATGGADQNTLAKVEQRYKWLCRSIKRTYLNSVVRWRNPELPEAPAGPNRSANPSNPDRSLWVGPTAMSWLTADVVRRIKIFPASPVEGIVSSTAVRAG